MPKPEALDGEKMKRQGTKVTKARAAGHQDCGICHPKIKAGRAYGRLLWLRAAMCSDDEQGPSRKIW